MSTATAKRIEQLIRVVAGTAIGKILSPPRVHAPLDPATLKQILVFRNDALGDVVVTTPLWRILKRQYPHLSISVLGSMANESLLRADPDVSQVFVLDGKPLSAKLDVIRTIRSQRWDLVMAMVYRKKSDSAILAKLLAPNTVNSIVARSRFAHYRKYFSIVTEIPDSKQVHIADMIRWHLYDTIRLDPDEPWTPELRLPPDVTSDVDRRIEEILARSSCEKFIHINLSASLPEREWGPENSVRLARTLRVMHPEFAILLTASPLHQSNAAASVEDDKGISVFSTASSVELCALIARASLTVSPDTSSVHIAASYGVPVVTLHYRVNEWWPYNVSHKLLMAPDEQSVHLIPVTDVIHAVGELLDQ